MTWLFSRRVFRCERGPVAQLIVNTLFDCLRSGCCGRRNLVAKVFGSATQAVDLSFTVSGVICFGPNVFISSTLFEHGVDDDRKLAGQRRDRAGGSVASFDPADLSSQGTL